MKEDNKLNYLAMTVIASFLSLIIAGGAFQMLVQYIQYSQAFSAILLAIIFLTSTVALGFGIASLVQNKNHCKISAILMGVCALSYIVFMFYVSDYSVLFSILLQICAVVLFAYASKGEVCNKTTVKKVDELDYAIKGLEEANQLLQAMIITQEEYDAKKAEYMSIINKY